MPIVIAALLLKSLLTAASLLVLGQVVVLLSGNAMFIDEIEVVVL